MSKNQGRPLQHPYKTAGESIRINPERRICPSYDSAGISLQLEPTRESMGVRVLDDFCEEHMM